MAEEEGGSAGVSLVAKILVVSGLLFCVVGVFLLPFVNTVAGIVVLVIGLTDLAMSVFFPKIVSKQG